jgi:hypothetical protein
MPIEVQGILVEKPNKDLSKWIGAIIFVHTAFTIFTGYLYELHKVSDVRWYGLIASWTFFGVFVPLLGYKASEKTEKKRLAIFGAIQGIVGFYNFINFLAFSSVLITVIDWCLSDKCLAQFETRNHSCLVQLANETYEMDYSYCKDTPKNIGTVVFFAALSFTSCMGAIHARKMRDVQIVQVITTEAVRVRAPMLLHPPEDCDVATSVVATSAEANTNTFETVQIE